MAHKIEGLWHASLPQIWRILLHIWLFQWNGIDILLIAKGENKDIFLAVWRVWFHRDFFSPSFSFLSRVLCVLKTFCSGELCISYSRQLRSHLWSWMRSLVHILFYLCLWSGFLQFFFKVVFLLKRHSSYNI